MTIPGNNSASALKETPGASRVLMIGVLTILGALLLYLMWVGIRLTIDYFDSYENFWNGLCIAGIENFRFSWKRPILLPLLISPFFYAEKIFDWPDFGYAASHAAAVAFFGLLLWTAYRLYRLHTDRPTALWGVLLLGLNRLLIHQAPFAKEDVLGSLVITAAFYFYLKAGRKQTARDYALSSCLLFCAISCRINFLPIVYLILFFYECLARQTRFAFSPRLFLAQNPALLKKVGFLFLVPVTFFLIALSSLYARFGLASFWSAPKKYVTDILFLNELYSGQVEPPMQNVDFLVLSFTWPLILLAAIGAWTALKRKSPGSFFYALWFSLFFLFQTFVIRQKESRYLFPLFPPLYFFVALGMSRALKLADAKLRPILNRPALTQIPLAVLLLILPMRNAVRVCADFLDPVYSTPYEKEVSRYAGRLSGNGLILWLGTYYTIHPRDYLFHPQDEFTSIYHFYNHVVRFFTRKQAWVIPEFKTLPASPAEGGIFVGPNIRSRAAHGTAIVINPDPNVYTSAKVPARKAPLFVERVQEFEFVPATAGGVNPAVFRPITPGLEAAIAVEFTPSGARFAGVRLPDRRYEVYLFVEENVPLPVSLVTVRNGGFQFIEPKIGQPVPLKKISLLYYDSLKVFPAPGASIPSPAPIPFPDEKI